MNQIDENDGVDPFACPLCSSLPAVSSAETEDNRRCHCHLGPEQENMAMRPETEETQLPPPMVNEDGQTPLHTLLLRPTHDEEMVRHNLWPVTWQCTLMDRQRTSWYLGLDLAFVTCNGPMCLVDCPCFGPCDGV
mmetsp:Transcript_13415/g.27796  ORF Transcript_13415/g.27796 Transcript_13415/m.27796 type:complete len:135 (-) Transcript_13415:61-465(-)